MASLRQRCMLVMMVSPSPCSSSSKLSSMLKVDLLPLTAWRRPLGRGERPAGHGVSPTVDEVDCSPMLARDDTLERSGAREERRAERRGGAMST